jgi:DNA-binding MarR family transcriptional regulator
MWGMPMNEQANIARAQTLLEDSAAARLEPSDPVLVELARQVYQARRDRSLLEGWDDLFGEPAWDMLLIMLIAAHENREVTATSACAAAGVPASTALRWLHRIEKRGIIVSKTDPHDHRRILVRISDTGLAQLNRYLRHIADGHLAFVRLTPDGAQAERPKHPAPA